MLHIKNPKQMELFDPWGFLGPKRRNRLNQSWAGLFRSEILPMLPATALRCAFTSNFGRPTKEIYTMLGTLILQQMFDMTDEETIDQLAYNLQWHYALNITEETDSAKYICDRTLWNVRAIASKHRIDTKMFEIITGSLAKAFNVNTDNQRLDSVHLKSNMRRLGRISIISSTIHKFLVNLKRQKQDAFDRVQNDLIERYFSKKAMTCFSMVKPSESEKTLQTVSQDLYQLAQQFKVDDEIVNMYSYQLLTRVLEEQCTVKADDNDQQVKATPKKPKEVPTHSLQNPSDPDASYCAHKGQGFKAQVMETYTDTCDKEGKSKELNLITHIQVETASLSDAHGLKPAIQSTKERGLGPKEVQADTLYGGDENWVKANEKGVNLISPVKTAPQSTATQYSFFTFKDDGHIDSCPQGVKPLWSKKKKTRYIQGICSEACGSCPQKETCPSKPGKKNHFLRYDERTFRLARRKAFEQTDQFLEKYRWRAGVEATMSEFDRRTGVKKLRVRGYRAVRFAVVLKAIGVNIFRATAVRKALGPQNDLGDLLSFSIFNPFVFFKERFLKHGTNILQRCIDNFVYYNFVFI